MRSASCCISSFSASFRFFMRASSKLVAISGRTHSLDFLVKAPVLDLEHRQYLTRVVVVHAIILQEARIIVTRGAVIGKLRD